MSLNVKEAVFAIECIRIEQLTADRGRISGRTSSRIL